MFSAAAKLKTVLDEATRRDNFGKLFFRVLTFVLNDRLARRNKQNLAVRAVFGLRQQISRDKCRSSADIVAVYDAQTFTTQNARRAPVPQYDLSVKIMPDAHRIAVTGTMILPAATESRQTIKLILSDLMHDFSVEVLEPQASAGAANTKQNA